MNAPCEKIDHPRDRRELLVMPQALMFWGENIPVAQIATVLGPRADEHIRKSNPPSRMDVVGYDGPSVVQKDYPWADYLKKWTEAGMQIRYLLIRPSSAALERLRSMVEDAKKTQGKIEVYTLDFDKSDDADAHDMAGDWDHFHFAAFDNPKQLWIEKNHPKEDLQAYDCFYFSPDKAKDEPLWDLLESQFDYALEKLGRRLL